MSGHEVINPVVSWVTASVALGLDARIIYQGLRHGGVTKEFLSRMSLYNAAVSGVCGLIDFADGEYAAMWIQAAVTAVSLAIWWHFGGGDKTKKRLKKLKEKFVGQRRTAPQTA